MSIPDFKFLCIPCKEVIQNVIPCYIINAVLFYYIINSQHYNK